MADATTLRLDTVDVAMEAGWDVETPMRRLDEFRKDGVVIEVEYGPDDEISRLTRSREGRADEVYGAESAGKAERLRIWLGIRALAGQPRPIVGDNTEGVPITVQRLRAQGMSFAAYVEDGDDIQLLKIPTNDAYATARDYIRAYDGRAKVMWKRDGRASEPGNDQEMWWAEMPLPDGRVVGWFFVNQNFPGRSVG